MNSWNKAEEQPIQEMICNQCGKKIEVRGGIPQEEMFHGTKTWGYFSHKDGEIHSFYLCEECYDKWIKSFLIPVDIQTSTELL